MATRYPSNYDNRGRVEPGISRGSRSGASTRSGASRSGSSGQRSASAQRSGYSGQRTQRPASGQRSGYSGQRAPQRSGQRPPQRGVQPRRNSGRGRGPNRTPIFAALAVVVVLVLVLVIVKPFGRPAADSVTTSAPVVSASNTVGETSTTADTASDGVFEGVEDAVEQTTEEEHDSLADKLADSDSDAGSLSQADMAVVSDLKINTNLPSEWLNILLLGTDERVLNDSARTDTMIICSVNQNTGELKLASIMRDLAIEFTDIGKYNGTYRINSANFFGGPNLAMRTVNEKFGMNIQYYAMVNFFGFQRIAEKIGGIDIDITEDEMNQINKWAYNTYKNANKYNIDISDVTWEKLETYGKNVHLNGTQTLAYARIRKLQGGDYMRTERQRTVLSKLLEKVKTLDAIQLAALANDLLSDIKTNVPINDLFPIGMLVCGNGLSQVPSMHLPVTGTYKQERRNNQDMLWDCDFQANAIQLYNFIYD